MISPERMKGIGPRNTRFTAEVEPVGKKGCYSTEGFSQNELLGSTYTLCIKELIKGIKGVS